MLEIVIMGGCMGIGNTGPVVEFNIQVKKDQLCMRTASPPTPLRPMGQSISLYFSHASFDRLTGGPRSCQNSV